MGTRHVKDEDRGLQKWVPILKKKKKKYQMTVNVFGYNHAKVLCDWKDENTFQNVLFAIGLPPSRQCGLSFVLSHENCSYNFTLRCSKGENIRWDNLIKITI